MRDRRIQAVVSILISIVLVAGIGFFYYSKIKEMNEKEERLIEANEKASVYENEIAALESEKIALYSENVVSGTKISSVTIAFVDMSEETYENAVPMMEEYGYEGTIVWLDSNYDLLDEWYIIELIEKGWDVVIGGDFILDEESLATMELMKSELEERDIFLNNIYYVDNLSLTASQQNEVLELGFDGYAQITKYTTTINSQTLENGLYQLEYAPFFYGENKLGTLLGLVVDQDAGYIVSIDAVVDEEDEKTNVNISNIRLESLLDLVTEYEEEGTMQVQILSEQIEYKNNMESAYSEELLIYEEAIVDIDCAIEELQAERDAVYAQWRLEEEEIEEGLR